MPTPIRSTTTLKKHFKIKAEAFACHRHFSKGSSWPSKMQSGLYMLLTLADNLSSWKVLPFLKAPCRVEQGCSSGLRKKGASIVEPSEFHQKRVKKAAYIHATFRVSTGIEKVYKHSCNFEVFKNLLGFLVDLSLIHVMKKYFLTK